MKYLITVYLSASQQYAWLNRGILDSTQADKTPQNGNTAGQITTSSMRGGVLLCILVKNQQFKCLNLYYIYKHVFHRKYKYPWMKQIHSIFFFSWGNQCCYHNVAIKCLYCLQLMSLSILPPTPSFAVMINYCSLPPVPGVHARFSLRFDVRLVTVLLFLWGSLVAALP